MGDLSRAILLSVAAEAVDDLNELIETTIRVITTREAPYGPRGTVLAEDLRGTVTANLSGMLEVLSGARSIGEAELSAPRSVGRRRAQQGIPLETVLRAYRLAGQVLMGALLDRAQRRSPAELAAFLEVATVALDVVDRYSQAVVESYRQTEAESQLRDSQRRQVMFDALLDGRGADLPVRTEAAAVLGLPTQGPYVVVVYGYDMAADHLPGSARDVCAVYSFAAAWRTRGDREIGIVALQASPVPRLLNLLRSGVTGRVGVSSIIDSLGQVPEAVRLAETALLTSPAEGRDVAWIDDRLVEAILISSPDLAQRLTERTLGQMLSLRESDREMLLTTLATWFDSGRSAGVAATRLYCHRNTILNRLRRIEKLSGASLDHHRDLLVWYLALQVLRLIPPADRPDPASTVA